MAARREGRHIERLPEGCRPADDAAGYAVQRQVMAALCGRGSDGDGADGIGGWKIGAGAPDETPLHAPILRRDIHPSGVVLPAADFPDASVETEIAFRLRQDLPARGRPYDIVTVAAAVEILPALELYRSRYRDPGAVSQAENLADCLANAALVVGASSAQPDRSVDTSWDIDLVVDGERREGRALRHPVRDPLRLVVWLADHLVARGEMLRAGQVITTGALLLAPIGRVVAGVWRDLGTVSVRFS